MSFDDALSDLSAKANSFSSTLETEEATKNALVMPFISRVLGYDVFNPAEVIPEFTADIGLKRGEKIDYAIVREGEVQMLVEAKKAGDPLNLAHASQLVRYFHTSQARIAVLTNGLHWHFYTDLERPNVMDETPFLKLNLLEVDSYVLPELRKLTKVEFDLESVLVAAEELKYVSAIKQELASEFAGPHDDLVKLLACRVYGGSMTAKMRDFFAGVTQKAMRQFLNDRVNERLESALGSDAPRVGAAPSIMENESLTLLPDSAKDEERGDIVTTEEELEAFRIIRAIAASEVVISRVVGRDTQSYFGVLLDDNNRKPVARLHFNRKTKYLGIFDETKNQTRVPLERLEDIYLHADEIRKSIRGYLTTSPTP